MKLQQKTVLITGASSGIGRAVATELGKRGNRIVATARRKELLDSLADEINQAGGQCLTIPADSLSDREAETVVSDAVARFGTIDAALLNIGDGLSFHMANEESAAVTANMRQNYDTMVHFLTPLIAK